MDTTPCQLDRTHTGVWACECANSGVFCSICILDHMGSAAQPHSVKPIGPVGQHVCGKCHGQPVESIRFKYDVCLCPTCAGNLTISSVAGQRFAPPLLEEALKSREAEIEAKQRIDHPSEGSHMRRSEGPRTALQRLIADKRNDIQHSLRKAYDNMNSLEAIIQEALNLEVQLTESRAEVQSLQKRLVEGGAMQGQVGAFAGFKEVVERVENVTRENENLRSLNDSVTTEVERLKTKLQAAEQELAALKERPPVDDTRMKEVLKSQLDEAVTMLKESILEQTQESAKVAAQKVTDVMPLVANLDLDNEWLNRDSLEKLLYIVSLSIEGFIDSENMREVSKTCVSVAKLLPFNRLSAVFVDVVGKQLKTKREEGMKLARAVQGVYDKTHSSSCAKEVMEGLFRILEKDAVAFEGSISIVSHLAKLLDIQELCKFAADTIAIFEQQRIENDERKEFLLSLPVEWSAQDREGAQQCIMELIRISQERNFDHSFLLLARLLHSGRNTDPASLFVLILKLAKIVPSAQLYELVTKLSSFFEAMPKSLNATTRLEAGFAIMKYLLKEEDAAPQEIHLLANLIDALKTQDALIGFLITLTTTLKDLRSDTASALGFAAINWVLPDELLRANTNFGNWLLDALAKSNRKDIEKTAINVASLLSDLIKTNVDDLESAIRELVNKNCNLQKVCSFASLVLANFDAESVKCISRGLIQLANTSSLQIVTDWMNITEALSRTKKDFVVKSYDVYQECIRRQAKHDDAATFGKECLETFNEIADSAPLEKMLGVLMQLLKSDEIHHARVIRLCSFWSFMHRRLPTDSRVFDVTSFFLTKVPIANYGELEVVIDSLEQTMQVRDGFFATTVYKLAEIYLESLDEIPVKSHRFIDICLHSLRLIDTLGQASKANLEALIEKARSQLRGSREGREASLRFLESSFLLSQIKKQEIDTLLVSLFQSLDRQENLNLLKTMRQIENLERYIYLLTLIRPDPNVMHALSKFAELTVYLEGRGIDVPKTTQEVANALLNRPNELASLLDSVSEFITKNTYFNHFQLAFKLMQELSIRSKEMLPLLKFFCDSARRLLDSGVSSAVVLRFSEVVLGGLNDTQSLAMLERLRTKGGNALQMLVDILNREREAVTLRVIQQIAPTSSLSQPQQLASVKATEIKFFDFTSWKWNAAVPLSSQLQAKVDRKWTFLDDNQLFCCGGYDKTTKEAFKEAYVLTRNNPSWTVDKEPDMITARYAHGIIYMAEFDTVFVFGGGNTADYDINKCEKIDFNKPAAWQELPNMREARCDFNPTYYYGLIYLCGYGSSIMEAFSPQSCTFVPLNIVLPEERGCCLYVDDDKLVVHSTQYLLKYRLNEANQLAQESWMQIDVFVKGPSSYPILDKAQRLVFMPSGGACVLFNMDTGVKVVSIS